MMYSVSSLTNQNKTKKHECGNLILVPLTVGLAKPKADFAKKELSFLLISLQQTIQWKILVVYILSKYHYTNNLLLMFFKLYEGSLKYNQLHTHK